MVIQRLETTGLAQHKLMSLFAPFLLAAASHLLSVTKCTERNMWCGPLCYRWLLLAEKQVSSAQMKEHRAAVLDLVDMYLRGELGSLHSNQP